MAKNKSDNLDALSILDKYKTLIWPKLKFYLQDPDYPQHFRIPKEYDKYNQFHWKLVNEYPNRKGKYLRPTLIMLTAQAMGASAEKALNTAVAMQISEEWILIHDDIEDKSILRRGAPALHKLYSSEFAINAGDMLHVIMWNVLADNISLLGPQKATEIFAEFYRMSMRTGLGQTAELRFMEEPVENFSEDDWFFIADSKSAYYSIAGPMRLGAIIANATPKELESISEFGLYLGRCFQLVDDILDVTSDFNGLKEQGNDIYEGKRTLLLSHVVKNALSTNQQRIINIVHKKRKDISRKEIEFVIKQMEECGSIDYATKVAGQLKEKAYSILKNNLTFLDTKPYSDEIDVLTHFVLERKH